MRNFKEIESNIRLNIINKQDNGIIAYLNHPKYKAKAMTIICTWNNGWEHTSVSLKNRCPTWDADMVDYEIYNCKLNRWSKRVQSVSK